uniref:Uncharacterized protein n=1 Tax=Ditylenchus dipsaci TaxID=166011 RepID=A0A915EIH5_9BILA
MLLPIFLFLQVIHFSELISASSSSSTLTNYGSDDSKALSSGVNKMIPHKPSLAMMTADLLDPIAVDLVYPMTAMPLNMGNSLALSNSNSLGSAGVVAPNSDTSSIVVQNSLALSNSNSLGSAVVVNPDSDTSDIAVHNSLALSESNSLGSVGSSAEKSGGESSIPNSLALSNSQSLGSAGSLTSDPDDSSLVDNTLALNNSQSLGSTGYQSSSSDSSKPVHSSLAISNSQSLGSAGAKAALDESIAAGTVSNSLAASDSMPISVENRPDSHSLGSTGYVSKPKSSEAELRPVSNSLKSSSSQSLRNKDHTNSMSLGSLQHSNSQSVGLSGGHSLSLGSTEVRSAYDASEDNRKSTITTKEPGHTSL